ncbi:MAG: FG-GAP-like repeat-containing protein [Gallionella sp.]|nr:FG-GAP-like repeat-containing protein [Gallionella sp.]MDD4959915.1 FG-GAP-like repeat-containing protein [Gallionella sp.]
MTMHLIKHLIILAALIFSPVVGAVTYAYDNLNRLTSVVVSSSVSQTNTYDAAGNILNITATSLPPQRILFGAAPMIAVGGTGVVTATATSGLPVSFTSSTPTICSIVGSTVTGVAAGSCIILANQAGNASFQIASQTNQIIPVKLNQIITIGLVPTITVGSIGTMTATSNSGLAVSLSSLTPTICSVVGNTVVGVAVGTCTIAANQVGNATYKAAIQVTQNISVGAAPTITLSPSTLTFVARNIGNPSTAQVVTLTNTGVTLLNISSILTTGDFARTTTCGATLAAGTSCTISVIFTATAVGARTGSVTVLSTAATSPNVILLTGTGKATYADFNGDGKSDMLWRNPITGVDAIWIMNGTTLVSNTAITTVPAPWAVAGMGDFNGDGKSDIVWRNPVSGADALWLMNGTTLLSNTAISTVPGSVMIAGVGDFNGDGMSDILWRNPTTGADAMWLMNGSTLLRNVAITTVPAPWFIAGTGDFNGDGKSDILWRNPTSGVNAIWIMNGITMVSNTAITTVPAPWVIAGTGDFNGDGKSDILWRNPVSGVNAIWLMNGSTLLSNTAISTVAVSVMVAGVGDYNGDGKSDIVWRNPTTGTDAIWLMNGVTLLKNGAVGTVPLPWALVK